MWKSSLLELCLVTTVFFVQVSCEDPPICTNRTLITRPGRTPIYRNTKICCDGYVEDQTQSTLTCEPVCTPPCTNGKCTLPDVCQCNPGYTSKTSNSYVCTPVCSGGCPGGLSCIKPDICGCESRYQVVEGHCSPICVDPCLNGTCVAPDVCQCNPGYTLSDSFTCEPKCDTPCGGTCVAPNTCNCDPGWEKSKYDNGTCIPVCEKPCGNGDCVGPGVCRCWTGYTFTINGCQPITTSTSTSSTTQNNSDLTTLPTTSTSFNTTTSVDVPSTTIGENTLDDTAMYNTLPYTDISGGKDSDVTTLSTNMYSDSTDGTTYSRDATKDDKGFEIGNYFIWIIVILIILVVLALCIAVCRRNKRSRIFSKGGSYPVAEIENKIHGDYSNFGTLKFSAIAQNSSQELSTII